MIGRSFKELRLLLLSSILTIAVIPLAILLLRDEQWAAGVLDICIAWVMLGLFLHVYFKRETRLPGNVMGLVFVLAALGSLYLQGTSQVYWLYPALASTFFLIGIRRAVLLCTLSFLAIQVMLWNSMSATDFFTISLTLLTNILFAYSFAITGKRQRARLQHLATVDPLTGAGNRRAQNEKLDAVNALFRRSRLSGSILILDVDHFKKINDTHGHIIGDEILIEVADLIRANTRPSENLYRYGGEEFIVIAEHTQLEGAAQLAENLRALIDRKSFASGIHLTVSFGVAELHAGEGRQGWLGRADGALFRAKAEGRNRVVVAPATKTAFNPEIASTAD